MLAEILISIVIDGGSVDGSRSAVLRGGVVFAPVDPYIRRLADRVEMSAGQRSITIVRGGASIEFVVGSPIVRRGLAVDQVVIAPFVRGGEPNIPLALTARALGETVTYDARARVIYVRIPRQPISRMTPFGSYSRPDSPVTFGPTATPAPRVVVTGIPRPRRTPILEVSSPR